MAYDSIRLNYPGTSQEKPVAEHSDTERLDWVLMHRSEFEEGFMRVWLSSSQSPSGRSGYHITKGNNCRQCIDEALDGNFTLID